MVKSKTSKKEKTKVEKTEEEGTSLDDAFADDEGVEYAPSKPKKEKKKKGLSEEEIEEEIEEVEAEAGGAPGDEIDREITVKASKPISKVKKGDKIKVDGVEYEVDSHYVLMPHPANKEMAIEVFNPKTDVDYQVRYFDDQVEATIDFYELQGEIMFMKKPCKKIEW